MWQYRGLSASGIAWLLVSALIFVAALDPSAVVVRAPWVREFARRLAPLENSTDLQVQSWLMLVVYVIQYLVLGGVFEGTHPQGALSSSLSPKHLEARRSQVWNEMAAGIFSLIVTIGLSIGWMYVGEPRTHFYGYFDTHQWTPLWVLGGLLAYVISFDTCVVTAARLVLAAPNVVFLLPCLHPPRSPTPHRAFAGGFTGRTCCCTRWTCSGTIFTTSITATKSPARALCCRLVPLPLPQGPF